MSLCFCSVVSEVSWSWIVTQTYFLSLPIILVHYISKYHTSNLIISVRIAGVLRSSAKLTAFLPSLSTISLSAPLIKRCLIDLVDCKSSDDLTAKCKGVRPFESLEFTSASHANIKLKASSAPEKAAQCRGVLYFLSLELMSRPRSLKKFREEGWSP